MDVRSCLEQIRSISDLREFQNIYPDINIEDGICSPDDESLFLTSSLAFLHKQLLKKLDDEIKPKSYCTAIESDLLILNSSRNSDKIYIKLKDSEKFVNVLRSEASLPKKKLSIDQILPRAKKPKNVKTKEGGKLSGKPSHLLEHFSSIKFPETNSAVICKKSSSSFVKTKNSPSFFAFFSRKMQPRRISSKIPVELEDRSSTISKLQVYEKYLKSYPLSLNISRQVLKRDDSIFLKPKPTKESLYLNSRRNICNSFSSNNRIPIGNFSSTVCLLSNQRGMIGDESGVFLTPAERSYLQMLPSKSIRPIKLSQSENFHRTISKKSLNTNIDNYNKNNNGDVIKLSELRRVCFDSETVISESVWNLETEMGKQPSKVSVCTDEENEEEKKISGRMKTKRSCSSSDYEIDEKNNGNNGYSYNFTDELKSSISTKLLEMVVNKVIRDLKNDAVNFS